MLCVNGFSRKLRSLTLLRNSGSTAPMPRRIIFYALLLIALSFLVLIAAQDFLGEDTTITEDTKREMDRYYTFEFEPKYRMKECVVDLRVTSKAGTGR